MLREIAFACFNFQKRRRYSFPFGVDKIRCHVFRKTIRNSISNYLSFDCSAFTRNQMSSKPFFKSYVSHHFFLSESWSNHRSRNGG